MAVKGAFSTEPRRKVSNNAQPPKAHRAEADLLPDDAQPLEGRQEKRQTPVPLQNTVSQHAPFPNGHPSVVQGPAPALEYPQGFEARSQDIIRDGELRGFSVEEYTQAVVNGIHDAMGESDLLTAGCALDQALGEFLTIALHAEGPKTAQEMGVKFCQTVLPFAQIQPSIVKYGELKRLKKP